MFQRIIFLPAVNSAALLLGPTASKTTANWGAATPRLNSIRRNSMSPFFPRLEEAGWPLREPARVVWDPEGKKTAPT